MTPKHPKITHVSQLSEHSSWKRYKRELLELEMNGAHWAKTADLTKESVKNSFAAYLSLSTSAPLLNWETYEVLGSHFEDIAEGRYPILLVSMPPCTGRSSLGSLFLSWLLGKDPNTHNFITSYSQNLSKVAADKVKQLVNTPSVVVPVAPGGSVCGFVYGNPDPVSEVPGVWLIDDYHKSLGGAVNEEWVEQTCVTRRLPNSAIVVLGTRSGPNDIFSYFLEKFGVFDPVTNPKGAVHINLSAIIESEEEVEADILGRPVGGSLGKANQYLSPENLKDIRRNLGDEKFSWLYKGCPPVSEVPPLDKVIISVDPAFSADSIDKTGICIAGVTKKRDYMYVLDTYEGNWDLKTVGVILSLAVKAYGAEEIVLEPAGGSAAWAVYLQNLGLEVCVGSKLQQTKLNAFTQMLSSGKVKFSSSDTLSALDGCDNFQISLSDTLCAILVSYSQLLPIVT
jgi:hypothetical protein